MTRLERRSGLLMRAYPAQYRMDRGEEIIGTLLEATPEGRSWPLARDIRGLVAGGLRARAALNRRLTTGANLRMAALVGATAYLAYTAVSELTFAVLALTWTGRAHQADWPLMLAGALVCIAIALAWLSSRRAVVLAVAIAAAIAAALSLAGSWPHAIALILTNFACLAALALRAGRDERPRAGWLWPLALIAAFPLAGLLLPGVEETLFLVLLEALGVVSLLWVAVDARPAVAVSVFVLALWLPPALSNIAVGPDIGAIVPVLIVIALALVAVWLLRRQSDGAPARSAS